MKNNQRLENGLKITHQQKIISIIMSHPNVESAWIFGSRAIGTFKENSDIDLVIEGEKVTLTELESILTNIEQTTIPYKVDLLIKHRITNEALLEHIEKHGVRWI